MTTQPGFQSSDGVPPSGGEVMTVCAFRSSVDGHQPNALDRGHRLDLQGVGADEKRSETRRNSELFAEVFDERLVRLAEHAFELSLLEDVL